MDKNELLLLIKDFCKDCRGPRDCIESCQSETLGTCALWPYSNGQADDDVQTKDLIRAIMVLCAECIDSDGEPLAKCELDCPFRPFWDEIITPN